MTQQSDTAAEPPAEREPKKQRRDRTQNLDVEQHLEAHRRACERGAALRNLILQDHEYSEQHPEHRES